MSYENGLRINIRIEKDIIPFLIRNHLWDKEKNEPEKSMLILEWVEKKEDITEQNYINAEHKRYFYWYFTKRGKENICKLINNLY